MNLYENNFFSLEAKGSDVYILVKEIGYDIRDFHRISEGNARILIDNFLELKRALSEASGDKVKIGVLKPEIEIFLSSDDMKCELKVNLPQDYIDSNREDVNSKILSVLKNSEIKRGIDTGFATDRIYSAEKFTIAEGVDPVQGDDAKVTYFARSDKKIEIKNDGKADYYNLNLIDGVKRGDWLGEKILASMGKEGFNVKGEILPGIPGKDELLIYDEKTVGLIKQDGKEVLRALTDGAVSFRNNKICVQGHLIIEDDVDFSVGNIDFNGHVTIKGTVKDGFSVSATHDISILGEMGIGSTGIISSSRGNVFIKGGVNGRNVTEIYADQNVYVKYANEAKITAGREINIGYYAISSNLYADNVLINGENGRLISGSVYAKSKVIAGVIGNASERETNINVHGFNRGELKSEFEGILMQYKQLLTFSNQLKSELSRFRRSKSEGEELNENSEYRKKLREYEENLETISHLNRKRVQIQNILTSRGEGEVSVVTGMHPKTQLELKSMKRSIDEFTKGSFYVENREIHFEEK